jgi:hypothetical protein
MPEAVKSPAMLIIVIVAFIVLMALLFGIFYGLGIGRSVCLVVGKSIVNVFSLGNILTGLSDLGVEALCNAFPI